MDLNSAYGMEVCEHFSLLSLTLLIMTFLSIWRFCNGLVPYPDKRLTDKGSDSQEIQHKVLLLYLSPKFWEKYL
jgi:hypothetical protein